MCCQLAELACLRREETEMGRMFRSYYQGEFDVGKLHQRPSIVLMEHLTLKVKAIPVHGRVDVMN